FSLDDDEDMVIRDITHLCLMEGRYRVEVSHVPVGNWVLIGGVDLSVLKTSTITNVDHSEEVEIFSPLLFNSVPVIKVACEPLQPSELPKMLESTVSPIPLSAFSLFSWHLFFRISHLARSCASRLSHRRD
ncbi:U5 small nuclear ribonucleoprotein component (U5 snRNP), putative, partial [Toxoplasma gondii ME49]